MSRRSKKLVESEPVLLAKIHEMASLYVLPSLVFMSFLWTGYDVETRLLPLTKYFGEDPQKARQLLARMHFLDESLAARIVKKHEVDFVGSDGSQLTTDEVFTRFIRRCSFHNNNKVHSGPAAFSERGTPPEKSTGSVDLAAFALLQGDENLQQFSYVHLISEMWPGRLLLDHRLKDKSSEHFRLAWLGCSVVAIITMIVILGLAIEQLWGDIRDVGEGQKEDIPAVVVELAYVTIIVYLGSAFLKNAVLPYFKAWKD